MAQIKSFPALRFAPELPIDKLTCQPYDVINAQQQDEYYQRHPYNIIRLELGKKYPTDSDTDNVYSRAALTFTEWQKEGILKADDKPCMYIYVQEFSAKNRRIRRTGFLTLLKASGYESGEVAPHEETLPGHKQDRFLLMQSTYANFSPIFGLYAQENREIDMLLAEAADIENREADIDFTDEYGIRQIVYKVDDETTLAKVTELMADLKIYIADGHHRYETASKFAKEIAPDKPNCGYIMINLVNLFDPGLIVLPTHRMVKNIDNFSADKFLSRLHEQPISIININRGSYAANQQFLIETMAKESTANTAIGLYMDKKFYLLKLSKSEPMLAALMADYSKAYRSLDVSITHSMILEDCCGIGNEQSASGNYISYTRDVKEAIAGVDSGEYHFALLLNSTRVEELLNVADAGEKMPQKSTFFYPKIIAGLTISKFD